MLNHLPKGRSASKWEPAIPSPLRSSLAAYITTTDKSAVSKPSQWLCHKVDLIISVNASLPFFMIKQKALSMKGISKNNVYLIFFNCTFNLLSDLFLSLDVSEFTPADEESPMTPHG